MTTSNAIDLRSAGIVKYDGAGTFSGITVTNHGVLIGAASNGITSLLLTNGQLPIGSTGADPSAATLTAGTGINISNGAGSITISSTVTSGVVVQQVRASTSANTSTANTMPVASIPQNTDGAEVLTGSITPTNASNILLIEVDGYVAINALAGRPGFVWALYQDSTADALDASLPLVGTSNTDPSFGWGGLRFYKVAGSTSATTFKVRIGTTNAGASVAINGGAGGVDTFGGASLLVMTITELTP